MKEGTTIPVNGNRYQIDGPCLGSGYFAEVFPARWLGHRKRVAVKLMHPPESLRDDICPDVVKRKAAFLLEVKILCRLRRVPWSVQIYEHGEYSGQSVIIEELLDHQFDISRQNGPLDLPDAYGLSVQLCALLVKAHYRHILYKDFKRNHFFWITDHRTKPARLKVIDWNCSEMNPTCTDFRADFEFLNERLSDLFPDPIGAILFRGGVTSAKGILELLLDYGAKQKLPNLVKV